MTIRMKVAVISIPKSLSTLTRDCIREIHHQMHGLRLNIKKDSKRFGLSYFSQFDGIIKGHFNPTNNNIKSLIDNNVKYIIMIRHPADQICAIYCDHLNNKGDLADIYCDLNRKMITKDYNKSIEYLIKNGYLERALQWMTDWVANRNAKMSIVIRYEDIKMNLRMYINIISYFLYKDMRLY